MTEMSGKIVSEPGFWDFQISRFVFSRLFVLQNTFGKSGGELSRNK